LLFSFFALNQENSPKSDEVFGTKFFLGHCAFFRLFASAGVHERGSKF